jgi:ATP-binding cassette subfamily B protein
VSKLKETAIIAVCAYLIIESKMTIGTLMSISYIVGQLSSPIIGLIGNVKDGQDAYISRTKIDDVLEVANEVKPDVQLQNPLVMADISLQNLSFKYPGSFNPFVIKDISFTIPKDKITAIVGSSGSGKTTLMKLLMRYYNPTAGCIQIGKTLFSEHDPDDWRERCGVVLQDGQIFSGSIEFNIALCEAEGVNYERMGNAIRISCLDEFVNSLPLKMETKIGNVGIQLSGGQRQRILIARAIYKNPEFIFFDEATSSLDANTEYAIMNNLNEFFKGRTVIVVAHRLSTVRNADQIIVIENGEMMEQGTHHELVLRQNRYYSLVRNQLELES